MLTSINKAYMVIFITKPALDALCYSAISNYLYEVICLLFYRVKPILYNDKTEDISESQSLNQSEYFIIVL